MDIQASTSLPQGSEGGLRATDGESMMSFELKYRNVLASIVMSLVCVGCENGMTPPPPPFEPKPEDVFGAWKFESGENALTVVQKGRNYALDHILLNADGTAMIFCHEATYGISLNLPSTFVLVDKTLVIESDSESFDTLVLRFDMQSLDALRTVDTMEAPADFSRVDAIPGTAICPRPRVINNFAFPVDPHTDSGLAFDGERLWFSGALPGQLYSIDPNNLADMGGPFALQSKYTLVESAQGKDLWFSCDCAPLIRFERRDPNEVQTGFIDLREDLNAPVSSFVAAYDATAGLLWVSTYGAEQEISAIDIDAATPAITQSFPFPLVHNMVSSGKYLWALDRQLNILIQIDSTTGTVVRSWLVQRANTAWVGVTFVEGRLFLLGQSTGFDGSRMGILQEASLNNRFIPDELPDLVFEAK